MSQTQQYIHLTNKQKAVLQKVLTRFVIIIIIFVTFFPFSLIWLFFIKKIKNYFLSNKELLEIKAKLKEFSLENGKRYKKNNWYGNQYKIEKDQEISENKEENRNNQSSFYEQNRKKLQEKFSNNLEKKSESSAYDNENSWRNAVGKTTAKNNNFFWNNKKSKTFWNGKSIWDDYESVTEKFSSNKK